MTTMTTELNRRMRLWAELQANDIDDLEPQLLRNLGVYGGAQGIWVDKLNTEVFSPDGNGIVKWTPVSRPSVHQIKIVLTGG